MSRTIRRKNVKHCYHWQYKNYFRRWVSLCPIRNWVGYWEPIDKEEKPKLWKEHWWKAHRDCNHRYEYTNFWPKFDEGCLRAESRRQIHKAMQDVEFDITIEALRKLTAWDPYW